MSQFRYPTKIRYEYSQTENVKLQYAHGVWGGINPQGEIEMNFYTESDKLPLYTELTVDPDGTYGPETAPLDGDARVVTRQLHSRVLMNYNTAKAFANWLQDKLDALEMDGDVPAFSKETDDGFAQ